jgi:hypothetical protein
MHQFLNCKNSIDADREEEEEEEEEEGRMNCNSFFWI